jgi:four helix bundle protein
MATGVKNLIVYQKSYDLAMQIFQLTKDFPKEEKYSLIDQIRRSSRAVSSNLAEAYCKRRYPAHFISKLTDADMENYETQTWLQFSFDCEYLSEEKYSELEGLSLEVGRLIEYMIQHPEKFVRKS